jgi:neutral amino acid transport system permease protein
MDFGVVLTDAVRSALGVNGAVFALAAIGLNLHFGYTGLLNFGHVAFLMMGAYGVAITVTTLGMPLLLGFFFGLVAAALLALLLGIPTLRLRTDYLAIVTIAIAEILRLLFRSGTMEPVTKGVFGIQRFADGFYADNPFSAGFTLFGNNLFSPNALWVITVTWVLVIVTSVFVFGLTRSPWGRVLRSIREDEDAARSLGKNVFAYKLQVLVVGGCIGALAGSMRALAQQNVNPDSFLPILTFFVYAALILGGPGTILGPIIGAITFWFLLSGIESFLLQGTRAGWIPEALLSAADLPAVRLSLVGLSLILLMAFRPQGFFGSREEMILDAR